MRCLSFLVLGTLVASAAPAHADQCAKNPRSVADQAAALVKKGSTVLEFCEPCGDLTPGKPYTVHSVASRDGELLVNGAMIDLAYLYLETGPDELSNVGLKTGCGASNVSEAIRGGKPTGTAKAPPPPPRPGRPSLPPPPPRATSASELAGTWDVKLSTRYSSCTATTAPAFSEWTIAYDQGKLDLTSANGADLTGTLDAGGPGSFFRATLKPKQRASGSAIHLSMFLKDRLSGWVISSVKTQNPSDPVCVIYQDLQATRR